MAYPSWRPAEGTIADVSLNTLESVCAPDATADKALQAYCGVAYAPWLGAYGSIIITGGGHSDSVLNAIYRYDIASRLCSKIKPSAPSVMLGYSQNADVDTGWMYADLAGNLQVGELFSSHNYNQIVCVPDNVIPGGGGNGWFISYMPQSIPILGQGGSRRCYKIRLGVDTKFTYFSDVTNVVTTRSSVFYDHSRGLVGCFNGAFSTELWLTRVYNGVHKKLTLSSSVNGYYTYAAHDTDNDLYLLTSIYGSSTWVINPNTGQTAAVTTTGTPPPIADNPQQAEWVQEWKCFVYINGLASNTVYFLSQPTDPFNQAWAWSSQTLQALCRNVRQLADFVILFGARKPDVSYGLAGVGITCKR